MPKCSLKNCKNITSRTLKKDGISYFRFPRDPIRCEEWASIVSQQRREEFFKPNNSSVVCSEHFFDEDIYVTDKGIKRLHKTAVPRVTVEIPVSDGDTEACGRRPKIDLKNKEAFKSPTTLSIGSILNKPRILMKRELHKCRKMLINKEKVIDKLRKKNSRLIKKCISLKNALKELKQKNLN